MKKRRVFIFAVLLLSLVMIGALNISASAATIASGSCGAEGDNLTWTLTTDGELIISGTGNMEGYTSSFPSPWYCYMSSIQKVTIENGVTSIGDYAFYCCTSLTSVTIPEGVTSIGSSAFNDCTSLTGITIPDSVTLIGSSAFWYCTNLTSIIIPDNVSLISVNAFYGCTSLSEITILGKTVKIYNSEYTFPSGAVICGHADSAAEAYAVKYNRTFLPMNGANGTCGAEGDNLTWVLTTDGELIISGTGNMEGYTSDSSMPWYSYRGYIKKVTIENGVTSVGSSAFYGCESLTNVTIPDGMTSIGSSAFNNCTSLTGITIPDSVTLIGGSAFWHCSSLTSIIIPDSVALIGANAFHGCTSLDEITILSETVKIHDSEYTFPSGAAICGYADSSAEAYAVKHNRAFKEIVSEDLPCVTIESGSAKAGETVVINIVLSGAPNLETLGASDIIYDENVLELIGFEWKVADAFLSNWDASTGKGAVIYSSPADLNGTIITLSFKVKDEAVDGEYSVSCAVTSQECDFKNISGKITIYSTTPGDLDGSGTVDKNDAIYLMMHIMFPGSYPLSQSADFTGDSVVDKADAIYLMMHIMFPNSYPIG